LPERRSSGRVWIDSKAGRFYEDSRDAQDGLPLLLQGLEQLDEARARVDRELTVAERAGARLVTVLDEEYPARLRAIFNLPPFLFIRGTMLGSDARAVAVVGTRSPSDQGIARARQMAGVLAAEQVTVVSGLAQGIDTAGHTAALVSGGRTIAVLGQGVATPIFPAANRDLAERICAAGALVSQFWPSAHPASWTFPRRNIVTSGISQGTVVVEAAATSGAKMQLGWRSSTASGSGC
jgi:DNA processing protein